MLRDDGEFGVVLIERGSEVGGGDTRFDIGTVARVVRAQELPDGGYALATVGIRRIRVMRWLPDDPYPLAEVVDLGRTRRSPAMPPRRRPPGAGAQRARRCLRCTGVADPRIPDLPGRCPTRPSRRRTRWRRWRRSARSTRSGCSSPVPSGIGSSCSRICSTSTRARSARTSRWSSRRSVRSPHDATLRRRGRPPPARSRQGARARPDRVALREEGLDQEAADQVGDLAHVTDPADQASETFEREKDIAILEQLEHELAEIEAALQRLDEGTYGIDEVTGEPIAPERLEAYPVARTNVDTSPS